MDTEEVDIMNDSVEMGDFSSGSVAYKSTDEDSEKFPYRQNPIAVDVLPRDMDIYSHENMSDQQNAIPIVFNVGKCVDPNKVCNKIPFCPPDSTHADNIIYVVPSDCIADVKDITNDGLGPWNSRDLGNYMKSTIKTKSVIYGADGIRVKDCHTGSQPDCFLRCHYAKNPNERNLIKRAYFAIEKLGSTRPLNGTFIVISYEFLGPATLFPRVHKSARHRRAYRRTMPSVANLIKAELMHLPPKEARDAVLRKMDVSPERSEEVIPMRAVYDIAKTVPQRARVMRQGRKPYMLKRRCLKADELEQQQDFLPDEEDGYVDNPNHAYNGVLLSDSLYYDANNVDGGYLSYGPVEVVESEQVECQPCYSTIEVCDDNTFRLPTVFLEGLSTAEQKRLTEKAEQLRVICAYNTEQGATFSIVTDHEDRKSFYVDFNVDLNCELPYCECGYSQRQRRICPHVLAVLFQRIDGETVLQQMQERFFAEQSALASTRAQRMRRALDISEVPGTPGSKISNTTAAQPLNDLPS